MWAILYYIFSYLVFFYTLMLMASYLYLVFMSRQAQKQLSINLPDDETIKYFLQGSPLTPAVSIIAPAFNEEVTIIDNVNSLMQIDYPNFEIIIVNDASTDRTMELLINEYKLVEVPYDIAMKVQSKPIKRVLKSTEERFSKLVVVDKEHGGRKADGSNAGINVCSNKYFVCTDVDCIIEPMALYRMMWLVVNSHRPMIGISATMLMSNGCIVEDGRVVEAAVPNTLIPMFQQLEYLRSFLISKLGWSRINALPNISGGFGLFDTDIAVKSGGYDPTSMAEDVDMLLRMVTYMKNTGQDFRLAQVPTICCWTEGPGNLKALTRQRFRWARGLFEIISNHRKLFFNPHYGPIGAFTLPYLFIFEFIAPVLELVGFIFMVWLIFIGGVNWDSAFVLFGMIYLFSIFMAVFVIFFDYDTKAVNWKNCKLSYAKLLLAALLEPFIYHPIITYCSNVGYWRFIKGTTAVWKPIQRRGVKKRKKTEGEK
ncbi:MAG: glycosyltransferase family 2 protein [Bacteroidaceae bacterium]|nr:glycosyltransferase family 2 protein [Bacteroidaceae bacterium]